MKLPGIPYVQSPNHSRRPCTPTAVVLHYTGGGDATGTLSWLTSTMARASAHFLVGRDGRTWQMVDLDRAAWHAGKSEWQHEGKRRDDVNDFSIGIELANYGPLVRRDDRTFAYASASRLFDYTQTGTPEFRRLEFAPGNAIESWWEPYYEPQLRALEQLLERLREHHPLELVGHEEIAVPRGRKSDPGPLFPWPRFGRTPTTKSVRLFG